MSDDLTDQPLGRVATKTADILRGRHRATFTPNVDTGDFAVAINAGNTHPYKTQIEGKK